MKNTETYMHNKKIIFSLLQKSKEKQQQTNKKQKKIRWKKSIIDNTFCWKAIKPSVSDKLVVKVGLHFDGKAKLSRYELFKGFNTQ